MAEPWAKAPRLYWGLWRALPPGRYNEFLHMFGKLRAELKAITEWSRESQILRTQTEKDAVVIRELRRREITRQLTEIAAMN